MSLSREIARWLQSNPGPLTAPTADEVWLLAKLKFLADRRWRGEEFDMAIFMLHMNSLGYTLEHRDRHTAAGKVGYAMLALPAKHRGF